MSKELQFFFLLVFKEKEEEGEKKPRTEIKI